ncbi:general substrate transporter [Talaromyces proteolyticus]|uniref:General substrate transporter n=1 Tax=Talaromyces proteolyticus TaxID=1131652 RepID=A0AAD4L6F5_9EURO|nr:general substrate transporter [Talaromyces proteolyticus]KAH8704794.1 general substrate transporter [Talaromyces proteolyticus]
MANLTLYNIYIAALVAVGGFSYGFGFSMFATSIAMPGFYNYFGLVENSDYAAKILGGVNGVFNFGLAMGALLQGWLSDTLGRKKALALAAAFATIGGALTAGSVAIPMLIVVRFPQGIGLGILLSLVPVYLTEVAPPHKRGMLSGLTTWSFTIGYLICAWIGVGAYFAKNEAVQWRMPIALSCFAPVVLFCGSPLIPESPRFLVQVGRKEEAWGILQKIHHDPTDPQETAAHAEFIQIQRQIEFERAEEVSYLKMLTKPSWRKRSLLAFFVQFASQSSGILAIANYMTLVFVDLGMTGVIPLVLYAVANCFGSISVTASVFLIDRVGRRTLLLIGFPILACILLTEGILQWKYVGTDNHVGLGAAVAVLYLYFIVFCGCIDVTQFVWAAEIFPTSIRSRGTGISTFGYFVGAITYTTPSAVAMRNIKHNILYLYMGLCIISTIIIYFFVPETKQLPVEEIAALFGDKVVVHLTADGQHLIEEEDISEKATNVQQISVV